MKLFYLEYFLKVVQYGNYHRAAEELNISQPAVTNAIRKMEDELGARLLTRKGNTLLPTPEGSVVIYRAKNVLHELEVMRAELEAHQRDSRIQISLAYCLCDQLPLLIAKEYVPYRKNINLILEQRNDRKISSAIEDYRYDLGITFAGTADMENSTHFGQVEFGVFFQPGHPLGKKEILAPRDMEEIAVYTGITTWRDEVIADYFGSRGVKINLIPTLLQSDMNIISLIENNPEGTAILPLSRAEKFPQLSYRRFDPPVFCELRVIWNRNRNLSGELLDLIAFLRKHGESIQQGMEVLTT